MTSHSLAAVPNENQYRLAQQQVLATPHVTMGHVPIAVNTAGYMKAHTHGFSPKNGVCFHETISSDVKGVSDVESVALYLARKDYGIYAVIDLEGYIAAAVGLGKAVFYHADSTGTRSGHVNHNKIGIELVSKGPLAAPTNNLRRKYWAARNRQIRRAAMLTAQLSIIHGFPLQASLGDPAGCTTHWEVSKTYNVPGGHTDCYPIDKGGYFPRNEIVFLARAFKAGWMSK